MPVKDRPSDRTATSRRTFEDGDDSDWPPRPSPERETEEQRTERLEREREAKRVSDDIDCELEAEKIERRKRKPDVKILLLGQAESGKSTMLRNFQLQYTPQAFRTEAEAWSAIIHLNLVRSVNFILSLLLEREHGKSSMALTDELRRLRMRLSPLRSVEEAFLKFVTGSADPHTFDPRVGSTTSWQRKKGYERTFEVSVKSGSRWKSLFRPLSGMSSSGQPVNGAGGKAGVYDELKNARMVLAACREDILALWENPVVKTALAKESMMLEFQSGFFLDQVERIAAPGYMPTSGDVLKARIETMGVEEHLLKMETGGIRGFNNTWAIYDVGGSRSQRAAWLPYFDDVNMILFIAPVSAFNQVLAEDRSVNRLWDTIFLWKSICGSKLLQKVEFVLLLNKYDILEAKLNSGVLFRKFVTSYKDKPNDIQNVLSYLKGKFAMIYKQNRQSGGMLHIHVTCATDANATSVVLGRIRQSIFTEHFEKADLL
ncbi:G-alpha-domain-containing protein [Stereum hirsutum FP-91666 SS1]|uniref:G-alpha-domain-containing protein n=1 Tax=Stereum hirsutum (strain FP-91666) TaxID=721885 RepID=UPI0004449986|nr:G-alpha-domain-containing protein [Stereum hirsutum FP-91666 SS1]EIM82077.1 G-alpha-domain-containing protein [Stereum hirsutum FP-91666 SS1]